MPETSPNSNSAVAATPDQSQALAIPGKSNGRPAFLEAVAHAYSDKGKNVVVLTGDTHDIFSCPRTSGENRYLELEQTIYQQLKSKFSVIRLDISAGLEPYDDDDLDGLQKAVSIADNAKESGDKVGNVREQIKGTRFSSLPALVVMRQLIEAVTLAKTAAAKMGPAGEKKAQADKAEIKDLVVVIHFAGSLFPAGDFGSLSELDRQRLVTFLNLIESPAFKNSPHLILLVAETRSEINSRIMGLPSVESVEIELPTADDRRKYVQYKIDQKPDQPIQFEKGVDDFVESTAGLQLTSLRELLESARRGAAKLTRQVIIEEINAALQADLGDIISLSRPDHTMADVIGAANNCDILRSIIRRCENAETAVSGILISGPNGGGKTFLMEAAAAESGRVVITLTGLRGMYFGQTDGFFEKLRLRIKTYGKILILVDEAHTAFGSVHKSDTHETEKRLSGNVIKMMGDRSLYGKVLWGLMTSRPDELDPDVKSRAPIQIPVFDLEGDERKEYVIKLFARKKITVPDADLPKVLELTQDYSNRDFDFLYKEVLASEHKDVLKTLAFWQASKSIMPQRRLQTMIAAQHCSYPSLLPAKYKDAVGTEEFEQQLAMLKASLGYGG